MDKQAVVHPSSGILLNDKNELTTDIQHSQKDKTIITENRIVVARD